MKSLGVRLALQISFVLFFLMLLSGTWIERRLTQTISEEEISQAEIHAKTLLASLQTLMVNGHGTLAREWVDRMSKAHGIVDIQVLRQDGNEAFTDLETVNKVNAFLQRPRFSREPVLPHRTPLPDSAILQQALNGNTAFDLKRPEEITVLMPIPMATECLACHGYEKAALRGVLQLSLSTENRDQRIARMRYNLWAVSAILVSFLAGAILLVVRRSVLKPLRALTQAITRVGEGDRDARLPVIWKDELGDVANVFNRMQKQLVGTETRIRSVMDSVVEAVITIDDHGVIESVNPAAEEAFGYAAFEMVGQNVSMLMPEPYRSHHDTYIAHYIRTGKGNVIGRRGVEMLGLRKNGNTFPLEIGLSEMRLDNRRFFVGVLRDITERKGQSAALEYQALHDALTDLPNRVLLADRLRQAILRAQRGSDQFAFLLMDLDHFKEINDTLGHQYGDLILQQVAKRVREALRESDTVARLGGDEFAVLLATSDEDHASQVAGKLLKLLERPFVLEGQALHIGASIGISIYPIHGRDEMTLMRLADVAMYVAKRATRGFAIYDAETDEHNPRNLTLLGELRSAIDLDELVLYYQPKVNLKTGKISGVEALVRWRHPQHGLMFPEEFVPLAEQTGLIKALTMWVLKEGVRQYQVWQQAGLDLDVAINLSVRNLQDMQFPERVAKILETISKPVTKLWLEITETAIMQDPERAQTILDGLTKINVMFSIDDFGTGYSSLAYLKQLPVREIKIDKSFVLGMMTNDNDAVIVRSIIDLAHNIGLHVIAEGVEDEATVNALVKLGCDLAQGYYYAKPLPVAEFHRWLRDAPAGVGDEAAALFEEVPLV